jgi:hypothetical protein
MRRRLFCFWLVVLVPSLAGCWESKEAIYDSTDFHLREVGEIITISDQHGPLGLYYAGAANQYLPIYTDAEPNTKEFLFRKFRIGMVPIDRALATERSANWMSDRKHSSALLKDGKAHLFIFVLEAVEVEGQGFAFGYVEGNKLSICPEVLQNGSAFHDRFKTFVRADGTTANKKRGVANLIFMSSGVARRQGKLDCDHYTVGTRSEEEFEGILQAIDLGDALRTRGRRGFPVPKPQPQSRPD